MPKAKTKTLVTGASGFIGTHLVRALAERGDELRVLARSTSKLDHLDEIDLERATGGVTDRRAVRRAMEGVGKVFHVAGSTSLSTGAAARVREVNATGTKVVMEEAHEAGVESIVHTSSVAAIGAAEPGGRMDEEHEFNAHAYGAYPTSKHEAELAALRIAAKGTRVVIVNPSFVLGPEDPSGTSMALIRRFLLGQMPAYVDGGLNVVDVRDVATGHLLADEYGEPGERYILANRNFTLRRLFADLSRISGVDPPPLRLPAGLAVTGAELAERLGLPFPTSPGEVRSGTAWWTCSPARAKRELGFEPRSHEETLSDAVEWQREQLGDRVVEGPRPQDALLGAVGRVLGIAERWVP